MSSVINCSPWVTKALLVLFPVPDKVQGISVSNSARSDYLKVSWVHATGDFDHYEVTIKNRESFIQTKTIPKSENECEFIELVPGRLYSVTVSTKSGQYEASEQGTGRTSKWGVGWRTGGLLDLKVIEYRHVNPEFSVSWLVTYNPNNSHLGLIPFSQAVACNYRTFIGK